MPKIKTRTLARKQKGQAGLTLIETMIALTMLLIFSIGILTLGTVSMTTTENQGHLAARTAEYAQDKMEQLLALSFNDLQTNTAVASFIPDPNAGSPGLAAGGSLNLGAPVAGYVDYLDSGGNPLGGAANGAYFMRIWQITDVSPTMKRITVTATVAGGNGAGPIPTATVTALKTSPF
jgi:type II secretory pathway pseudopilin PulG